MKKIVLEGPWDLRPEECAEPSAGPGEVIVEVRACGICGSDIHAYLGDHPLVRYPVTPGHEFAGVVTEAGEGVDRSLVGAAVCVEPSLACGRCPLCLSGRYNICSDLKVMGFQAPGAMCEKLAVPADRIHILPRGVDPVGGALAEPAAVGVHALGRAGLEQPGDLLVIGGGVIGLMVTLASKACGHSVTVIEASYELAERAGGFGADRSVLFDEGLGPGDFERPFDAVFECVGKAETVGLAVRLAPRGSTVLVVGVSPGALPVDMPLIQDGELCVKGSLMYTGDDFREALRLIGEGIIDPEKFVTHTFRLCDCVSAYRTVMDPKIRTLKVLLEMKG